MTVAVDFESTDQAEPGTPSLREAPGDPSPWDESLGYRHSVAPRSGRQRAFRGFHSEPKQGSLPRWLRNHALPLPGIKPLGRIALEFGMAVGKTVGLDPFAIKEGGLFFTDDDGGHGRFDIRQ
jgi:hypothetical protein